MVEVVTKVIAAFSGLLVALNSLPDVLDRWHNYFEKRKRKLKYKRKHQPKS